MPVRIKKAKEKLEKLSHDFVRRRDSVYNNGQVGGNCIDCGKYVTGQAFQCGHFEPSGSCGVLLRYHPHNMHGQASGCNMGVVQERVKINYTLAMIKRYGEKYVRQMKELKQRNVKADILFYERMIELYEAGDEKEIIKYLNNYGTV